MNIISYLTEADDLKLLNQLNVREVIISSVNLSRYGKVKEHEITKLVSLAKTNGMIPILECDILLTENEFQEKMSILNSNLEIFDIIRVQDVGVLNYVLENTDKKIQFIVESNNHNIVALKKWRDFIGDRLDRIVLSIELPQEKLMSYTKELECHLEILSLGPILLFYSPRNLLSALMPESDERRIKNNHTDDFLDAIGASEESPHKGFPIIENRHGTFMFHIKNFNILEYTKELCEQGMHSFRLDFRDVNLTENLAHATIGLINKNLSLSDFKSLYPKDMIKGFYHVNKSDVLFKKLKNSRLQRVDSSYVGEVIDSVKGEIMAISQKSENKIKLNDTLKFINPEGKEFKCQIHFLKNLSGHSIYESTKDEIFFMNPMKGIWNKAQVYLDN